MKKSWVFIILAGLGLTAIVGVWFAVPLGLAHGTSWGKGRILLCAFGFVLILASYLILVLRWKNHWIKGSSYFCKTCPPGPCRKYLRFALRSYLLMV